MTELHAVQYTQSVRYFGPVKLQPGSHLRDSLRHPDGYTSGMDPAAATKPAAKRTRRWRLPALLAILVLLLLGAFAQDLWLGFFCRVTPLDPLPASANGGRLERHGSQVLLRLAGTPAEMGSQHGGLLKNTIRRMLDAYLVRNGIVSALSGDPKRVALLQTAHALRNVLPAAFAEELDACAQAAGVDVDLLLLAQCEGDLREAAGKASAAPQAACSSYVAFGSATKDGRLECGRNLDYPLDDDLGLHCALVMYVQPADGYAYAAIGMAGILTGGTLVNERGLIVANHLGGGTATRLDGIPALLLTRWIAQHCANVEEAVAYIKEAPRMRGQIVWLAQEADAAAGRPARAVAVEYDAERAVVREALDGVLIVTNTNCAFDKTLANKDVPCNRYKTLDRLIAERRGKLDGGDLLTVHDGVVNGSTFHAVLVVPAAGTFTVRQQMGSSGLGVPESYDLPGKADP